MEEEPLRAQSGWEALDRYHLVLPGNSKQALWVLVPLTCSEGMVECALLLQGAGGGGGGARTTKVQNLLVNHSSGLEAEIHLLFPFLSPY